MTIGCPIEKLQQQRSRFTAKHFALAAKLLTRYRIVVRRFRKLYVFTGTQGGFAHGCVGDAFTGLGEVGKGDGNAYDTFGTGDQLQVALIPKIQIGTEFQGIAGAI